MARLPSGKRRIRAVNARLFRRAPLLLCVFALSFCLFACDLHFGTVPTPTPSPTVAPTPILTVVWVDGGDLFAWRGNDPMARKIASGGAIQPYLALDGRHVAFTRGSQGNAISLWE